MTSTAAEPATWERHAQTLHRVALAAVEVMNQCRQAVPARCRLFRADTARIHAGYLGPVAPLGACGSSSPSRCFKADR